MSRLRVALFFAIILGLAADASAQRPPQSDIPDTPRDTMSGMGTLVVRVRDHRGVIMPHQALVHLYSHFNTVNITEPTRDGGEAVFRNIPVGGYRVEVTALGYQKADEEAWVHPLSGSNYTFVNLQPESPGDTAQAPPTAAPVLAPKARKELEAGLEALKTEQLEIAQKHLERALKLAPGNPDVNYLAGVLYLKLNDGAKAKSHLEKAVQLQPDHYQALAALGILLLRERDYPGVIRTLEQALALNPQSWDGHNAIARAYWAEGEYEKTRAHAGRALELGEPRAPDLRILLALALAKLGEREKAAGELELFLQRYPDHQAAGNAQRFLTQIRDRPAATTAAVPAADLVQTPPAAAVTPALAFPNWAPPEVDTGAPPVAADPPCSLPTVLAGAARQAKALVENLQRFTAIEQIEYSRLADDGTFKFAEEQKVNYLVFIQEIRPGILVTDESRSGGRPVTVSPTQSNGLASLALIFHPYYVEDFEMRCEGLGEWKGQPAWQVYFRQRDDRPPRFQRYRTTHGSHYLKLKGRAWIAANSYNVVRLETDLLEPIPLVQLERHHLLIEYQPIQFTQRKVRLWLPAHAELYLHLKGRRYRHRHDFSDYKLFSVEVSEKIQLPQ